VSGDAADLPRIAAGLRADVLRMVHVAGDGHPGPCLSAADIIAALYFAVMRVDPAQPGWPDRDRLILSKGHACPVVYAALVRLGFMPPEVLGTLRGLHSMLQGHPDMIKTPGIDMTAGSLGNGLSIGLGMALAGRYAGRDYGVHVIAGDGEMQEGIVWEAAMAAAHFGAGRLTLWVDHNGWQSGGRVAAISALEPIPPKLAAFGWHVQEIDGHDHAAIVGAARAAACLADQPSAIVAHTIKGKGVPFIENDNTWHKRVPTADELQRALIALGEA
jgi:transketolase